MDFLAWFLCIFLVVYAGALTIKTGKPLIRYQKAKNRVERIKGTITSCYGEETERKDLKSLYPIYECEIDGEKKKLSGLVRYLGERREVVGKQVNMFYDKETGELWSEEDLPLMKKQIIVRLITVLVLVALVIITSIWL